MSVDITRRGTLAALSGMAALQATRAAGQVVKPPANPAALNIIDVAGNLQLTQTGIERFARDNPRLASRVSFSRAPLPSSRPRSRRSSKPGRSISTSC